MDGILVSFWDTLFSGAFLVSGSVANLRDHLRNLEFRIGPRGPHTPLKLLATPFGHSACAPWILLKVRKCFMLKPP